MVSVYLFPSGIKVYTRPKGNAEPKGYTEMAEHEEINSEMEPTKITDHTSWSTAFWDGYPAAFL